MKIDPIGPALSTFLAIAFMPVVALRFGLHTAMIMETSMNRCSSMTRTGMAHHGPAAFFVGVAVACALGLYTALLFVPLHDLFNWRRAS